VLTWYDSRGVSRATTVSARRPPTLSVRQLPVYVCWCDEDAEEGDCWVTAIEAGREVMRAGEAPHQVSVVAGRNTVWSWLNSASDCCMSRKCEVTDVKPVTQHSSSGISTPTATARALALHTIHQPPPVA
jgi:hypothetical protein